MLKAVKISHHISEDFELPTCYSLRVMNSPNVGSKFGGISEVPIRGVVYFWALDMLFTYEVYFVWGPGFCPSTPRWKRLVYSVHRILHAKRVE